MKISFDRDADALYIQFRTGKVKKTKELAEGIMVDVATDGKIFGIEILDASRRIPRQQLLKANLKILPNLAH